MKHWVYLKVLNMLDIFQKHMSVHFFFFKSLLVGLGFTGEKLPWLIKEFSNILTVKQHYSRSDFTH